MVFEEIYSLLLGFGCYVMGFDVFTWVTKHYGSALGVPWSKRARALSFFLNPIRTGSVFSDHSARTGD